MRNTNSRTMIILSMLAVTIIAWSAFFWVNRSQISENIFNTEPQSSTPAAVSTYYMRDDVQYYPVGPEFKLSGEAAALKDSQPTAAQALPTESKSSDTTEGN